MEDTQDATAAIAVPADEVQSDLVDGVHPAVGLADGALINGEKIVYEYDAAGDVVGWHKERLTLLQMAELGDANRPDQTESEAV